MVPQTPWAKASPCPWSAQVGRQLYTVTGHRYDEDELQEVVDSGGQDQIYQQAFLAPGAKRDVRPTPLRKIFP